MKWTVRAVVLSGLFALAPVAPASAQPYPIPPVNPCASTPSPVDLGTRNVGDAFGTVVCGPWLTPQNVNATINGVNFQKPVNADGSVSVTVTITSPTSATVNPPVPIQCGQNIITLSGTGIGNAIVTKQVIFSLNCNQFGNPFVPAPFTSFFPGSVFPGLNSFAVPGSPGLIIAPSQTTSQQEQQQQQSISVPAGSSGGSAPAAAAAPAAATQGRVAFTGANVVRWSIAALVLMAIGTLLIVHSRRRRPLLG